MDDQKEIYKYLNREMSPQEMVDFESRLKNDTTLKKQFTMENTIVQGIEAYGRQIFKSRVGDKMSTYRKHQLIKRILLGLLAFIIIIALYLSFYNNPKAQESPQQIFASHYRAPRLATGQRSGTTTDLESQIKKLYNEGEYTQLSSLFLESQENIDFSSEISLMSGISFMEVHDYIKAKSEFLKIPSHDLLYYDHAQWYLGLSHLALGEKEQAKAIFIKISTQKDHDYYENSKIILNKL